PACWLGSSRAGFAPAGRRTGFRKATACLLLPDQPCLVAPRSWSRSRSPAVDSSAPFSAGSGARSGSLLNRPPIHLAGDRAPVAVRAGGGRRARAAAAAGRGGLVGGPGGERGGGARDGGGRPPGGLCGAGSPRRARRLGLAETGDAVTAGTGGADRQAPAGG